jgi:ubiquinol-cytochrome c reductase iron-sulfur subunit
MAEIMRPGRSAQPRAANPRSGHIAGESGAVSSPLQKPTPRTACADRRRRRFLLAAASAVGGAAALAAACPFVASLAPSARARAAGGPVEADVAAVGPGELHTVVWRGQPVWLFRRTPRMLESLKGHDAQLVDPRSQMDQQPPYCRNQTRSIKPELLVAVGLCTHLGCSPHLRNVGEQAQPSEFYCPCHGSRFDLAGRVYKDVPAPKNLLVPRHRYLTASRIVVGEDKRNA